MSLNSSDFWNRLHPFDEETKAESKLECWMQKECAHCLLSQSLNYDSQMAFLSPATYPLLIQIHCLSILPVCLSPRQIQTCPESLQTLNNQAAAKNRSLI